MMKNGMVACLLLTVLWSFCRADLSSANYCQYVTQFDCDRLQKNLVCASNGVTYRNDCNFSQAHCRNAQLQIAFRGSCKNNPRTTPTTSQGADLAFDIFCLDLFQHNCSADKQHSVCGSNGVTYPSLCEFDKQRCTHRQIYITKMSSC